MSSSQWNTDSSAKTDDTESDADHSANSYGSSWGTGTNSKNWNADTTHSKYGTHVNGSANAYSSTTGTGSNGTSSTSAPYSGSSTQSGTSGLNR